MSNKNEKVTDPKKVPKKTVPKKKKNYLNNADMIAEIKKCHLKGEMTNEFAKMIQLLADRYAGSYMYTDYQPHIEDMKAIAVMNVVRAWRGFDLNKSNNPFAYFTQAIKHSFWQYCTQEKKHRVIRDTLLIDNGELPSDAYMEDYEQKLEEEKLEKKDENTIEDDYDDEIE